MNLFERCDVCKRLLIFDFGKNKARGSRFDGKKWHDICSKCVMKTIIKELER